MATALAAATAHSNCGQWQRTAAVELDVAGRTDGERLLFWMTAAAMAAATAHSNCGGWQGGRRLWDNGSSVGGSDGAQQLWTVAADSGCGMGCGRAHQR